MDGRVCVASCMQLNIPSCCWWVSDGDSPDLRWNLTTECKRFTTTAELPGQRHENSAAVRMG